MNNANGNVCRVFKNQNYTVMSNYHLRDKRLSLKSIGLLSIMLSLPEDWNYSLEGLTYFLKDGITAIRTAIKELTDCGYIKVERERNNGRLGGVIYNIYEYPQVFENALNDPSPDAPTEDDDNIKTDGSEQVASSDPTPSEGSVSSVSSPILENLKQAKNAAKQPSETAPPILDFLKQEILKEENRRQLNTDNKENTDINNIIYTSCVPNEDMIDPLSVSPVSPCGTKTEEDVASLKERIGYDRLIELDYPKETLDLLTDVMLEVYRTDKRQMRCAGQLRSVKSIRARLDQLDSVHVAHVLDCYFAFDGTVDHPRPYLRTALFNALVSFNEDQRAKHPSSEDSADWMLSDMFDAQISAENTPDRPAHRS